MKKIPDRKASFLKKKSCIKQIEVGSELVRGDFIKDKKSYSKTDVIGKCCLVDECIDKCSLLIGFKSNCCENCDLPIHLQCVESFGWKHNNYYHCCHDCMIGEKMKTDGHPYTFVTFVDRDTYFCFF